MASTPLSMGLRQPQREHRALPQRRNLSLHLVGA